LQLIKILAFNQELRYAGASGVILKLVLTGRARPEL